MYHFHQISCTPKPTEWLIAIISRKTSRPATYQHTCTHENDLHEKKKNESLALNIEVSLSNTQKWKQTAYNILRLFLAYHSPHDLMMSLQNFISSVGQFESYQSATHQRGKGQQDGYSFGDAHKAAEDRAAEHCCQLTQSIQHTKCCGPERQKHRYGL